MKFQTWSVVKNYDAVDADARILDNGVEAELNLTHYSLARFRARLDSVEGGMRYRFGYESQLGDGVSMQIVCTILDREGKPLFRVHANAGETVLAPEGAAYAELDLCMFGFTGGAGRVTDVFMEKLGGYSPKKVKLAAIMVAGDEEPSIEGNIRLCAQRIDAAAAEGADLALLPETYNTRGVKGLCSWQGAACMNEPAVTMLQEKAKQHRIYVAASVRLKDADSIVHNGIVMFDPEGQLIGTYTKCHLTMGEIWDGLKPGTQINTCDTALGRIGFSICWDRFFPEHARVLFMKHADIILNPTASSEYPLKDCHNGYSNAAFIVTAHTTADPSLTRITGRNGQLLAAADPEKGFAIAEVDVNAVDPVFWLSAPDTDTDPRSVYCYERRPELYLPLLQPESAAGLR